MPILMLLLGIGLGAGGLLVVKETVLKPGRRWIAVTFDEDTDLLIGQLFDTEAEATNFAEALARQRQIAVLTAAVEDDRILPETFRSTRGRTTDFVGPLPV